MTEYGLVAEPQVDLDVGAAFAWYEAYDRIADGPFKYRIFDQEFGEHYYDVSRMRCTLPSRRTW